MQTRLAILGLVKLHVILCRLNIQHRQDPVVYVPRQWTLHLPPFHTDDDSDDPPADAHVPGRLGRKLRGAVQDSNRE